MINFLDLQEQQKSWAEHNFPARRPHQPLLGLAEEVGELTHAHLKAEQGIRGSSAEHHAAKVDAVGDIVIYLADYCSQNNINFQSAVEVTWAKVQQRDWQANSKDGT